MLTRAFVTYSGDTDCAFLTRVGAANVLCQQLCSLQGKSRMDQVPGKGWHPHRIRVVAPMVQRYLAGYASWIRHHIRTTAFITLCLHLIAAYARFRAV
jgi:hypothetical protein